MTAEIMWTLNVFCIGFIVGAGTMALLVGSAFIWMRIGRGKNG